MVSVPQDVIVYWWQAGAYTATFQKKPLVLLYSRRMSEGTLRPSDTHRRIPLQVFQRWRGNQDKGTKINTDYGNNIK